MFRNDGEFLWKPGRLYIPGNWFTGNTVAAVDEGGATSHGVGALWASVGAGVAVSSEISTFNISAPLIGAAGDRWSTALASGALPNMDVTHPIYFRVHWTTASTTAADDMTWIVTYADFVEDATITDGTTALSQIVPSDLASGEAYDWQVTDWGTLDGGTLSKDAVGLVLRVEADVVDMDVPSTEPSFFLGLEMEYTPKMFQGGQKMRQDAHRNVNVWEDKR